MAGPRSQAVSTRRFDLVANRAHLGIGSGKVRRWGRKSDWGIDGRSRQVTTFGKLPDVVAAARPGARPTTRTTMARLTTQSAAPETWHFSAMRMGPSVDSRGR